MVPVACWTVWLKRPTDSLRKLVVVEWLWYDRSSRHVPQTTGDQYATLYESVLPSLTRKGARVSF